MKEKGKQKIDVEATSLSKEKRRAIINAQSLMKGISARIKENPGDLSIQNLRLINSTLTRAVGFLATNSISAPQELIDFRTAVNELLEKNNYDGKQEIANIANKFYFADNSINQLLTG